MGLLCLPPKVWYNKIMETISGGPKPTFNADEVLKAVNLNQATKNWVATEVPPDSDGNVGDVVFIPGGPGGLPAVAGGKFLQIVRATDGTLRRTTSTTDWVDASLSVTITPSLATSAVILIWTAQVYCSGTGNRLGRTMITDSSNNIISGAGQSSTGTLSTNSRWIVTEIGYSTPATTSAITYKARFRSEEVGTTIELRNADKLGQLFAIEVGA